MGPHQPAGPGLRLALCPFPQLTREFFTKELTKHYQGSNDTDVFSATWNSVMITVSDAPRDAESARSHEAQRSKCLAPSACASHQGSVSPGALGPASAWESASTQRLGHDVMAHRMQSGLRLNLP